MQNPDELLLPLSKLRVIRDNFVEELRRASTGEKTSLAFLRNPLPRRPIVVAGEAFQAMVVGGTQFEQATVGTRSIGVSSLESVPAFKTKEDFLSFLVSPKFLRPHPHTRVIAINFAFPLRPIMRNGRLDGILLHGTKEHQFAGLVGKVVGEAIEQYVQDTQNEREILVTVANDTVCLILSGLRQDKRENLAAVVVGTGFNLAFFEDEHTVVNLESGNFDRFEQTETGAAIDMESENPGGQRFEKEVSGAYLYQHFNAVMREMDTSYTVSSTEELSNLAMRHTNGMAPRLARDIMERSASLVACQIAGIYQFKGQPELTFVMEGSLFWKGWRYKEMVEEYLEKLDVPHGTVRFVEVENSALRGAAALGNFTNQV